MTSVLVYLYGKDPNFKSLMIPRDLTTKLGHIETERRMNPGPTVMRREKMLKDFFM